jgi:hypothetical protein
MRQAAGPGPPHRLADRNGIDGGVGRTVTRAPELDVSDKNRAAGTNTTAASTATVSTTATSTTSTTVVAAQATHWSNRVSVAATTGEHTTHQYRRDQSNAKSHDTLLVDDLLKSMRFNCTLRDRPTHDP